MGFFREFNDIKRMAINEAAQSYMPGRLNGPADAYRHILWAAEPPACLPMLAKSCSLSPQSISDSIFRSNPSLRLRIS